MVLTVGILPIGSIDATILYDLKEGLIEIFPEITCIIIDAKIVLPETTFDKSRKQYRSNQILGIVQSWAAKINNMDRMLGVANVDIFVPELNFVFGVASVLGKAALISLWRLKPEFYGSEYNPELYVQRTLKEAVHEVGHTLGLKHCPRSNCVMHFSNSIFDTDKKQTLFCDQCYLKAALAINNLEKT